MRPQLSVCFAAPCSLANHRPQSRAQGVAPQASQLRNGMTSGLGMVNSRVQIWQETVWGKGFERQASAILALFFLLARRGFLLGREGVRPPRAGLGVQGPGAPWVTSGGGPGTVASARGRFRVRAEVAKNRFACLGSALFLRGAGLGVRPKLFEACFPLPQSVRRRLGLFCAAIDLRRARFSCSSLGLRSPQVMYFAGQRAVAGLGAEPSEKPRTATRTFQIQNPICGAPETRSKAVD